MNNIQRTILAFGGAAFIGAIIYPPWVRDYRIYDTLRTEYEWNFLFADASNRYINFETLVVELLAIMGATGLLMVLTGKKKD